MLEPTSMSPGSIMPAYPNIIDDDLNITLTGTKIKAMQMLGVPYPKGYDTLAAGDLDRQSIVIQQSLAKDGIKVAKNKEIIAVIAYLQRLGKDIKIKATTAEAK